MDKSKLQCFILFLVLVLGLRTKVLAQYEINGLIIEQGELRHGYGTVIPKDSAPAGFVTGRARIQFAYKSERMEVLKGVSSPAPVQNWAYVMLIFRPKSTIQFIGLLF